MYDIDDACIRGLHIDGREVFGTHSQRIGNIGDIQIFVMKILIDHLVDPHDPGVVQAGLRSAVCSLLRDHEGRAFQYMFQSAKGVGFQELICGLVAVCGKDAVLLHIAGGGDDGGEGLTACPMLKEGQVFYADYAKPEGFCDEAWKAIYQYAFALSHGAGKEVFYYGDWIRKPGVAICSCNDGLRPVIFKLEATDEESEIDYTPVR